MKKVFMLKFEKISETLIFYLEFVSGYVTVCVHLVGKQSNSVKLVDQHHMCRKMHTNIETYSNFLKIEKDLKLLS